MCRVCPGLLKSAELTSACRALNERALCVEQDSVGLATGV